MGATSHDRTLVLHGLRLKGIAEPAQLAPVVDLDAPHIEGLLDGLQAEGAVVRREGRFSGFALTADGRDLLGRLLAEEVDGQQLRDAISGCYERFRELNGELLEICTRWQLREVDGHPRTNDHTDPAHDQAVVADLAALHLRARPLMADLASLLARFARYGPALDDALGRVQAGDLDALTAPRVPSYHTIWFELHEDLLATLGIDRGSEPQPA